ncbi:catalase family protein [Sphingomonas bacterium]|uniref:catalase family protein n=1 Tax=Sphingomonas bacterium TaxID=1895847 RepID=UPI0015769620|nr:catalase family protein [Sphingomonas bacterium]
MPPLPYADDIETPEPDEQASIDGIIAGMTTESRTVEQREGQAVRASHAKSTACVIGDLTVAAGLPPELAQGLFSRAGTLPVAVRFAQGPGERLGDRVSTHRGMAIKVFGVEGERLPGHDAPTQDFVLASGPTFPAGTAAGFLSQAKKIGLATPMPESVKSVASSLARNLNKVVNAVTGGPSPLLDFYGHPFGHPLDDYYFSQCPMRFGDHVAKLGAFPVAPEQLALDDWQLDPKQDEDGFCHAAVAYFDRHDAVFELRAQLWTNAATQPIEDTSVEWPAQDSEYRTVATIRLPRQAAYGPNRVRYFDEIMTFRPAHSLAAHQPLGGVMRARLQVYRALSDFRHRENGVSAVSPASVDAIPA